MHTTHLRKVGGSVMLSIPPALLDVLGLQQGAMVSLALEDGHLIVLPVRKPRYSLSDLLAQCDPDLPITTEDQAWLDAPATGNELL
ncbi:AbrB/MazE/SpoVT family DNA-binding domain-containing protein [Deinococcus aquiradiocola]|uniref:Antitoxin PemI n=1 Tax=Deinococcus aquiradiocola TaxID=393059 RepID=A0A917PHK3_9DEIO|nr:AbrB/MazE/SpoVT family DNA-binding domain-containing protein [Deinococcus aquiradiocola]GGJ79169.1 antitoxin PemI [Deinococcus aquiradiocola]